MQFQMQRQVFGYGDAIYVNEVNMDFISGVDKNCSDDDDDIDVVE